MGELIDAGALLEKLARIAPADVFCKVKQVINELPTIAGERHGKWEFDIYIGKPYCTECGHEPYRKNNNELPNYCPQCGARMDGE